MMKNAIEIKNLSKTYKASGKAGPKMALDDVSINIPRGSIFGLLGPNGAGKSTIINIMAGLVVKSSGQVKIWDRDIDTNPRNAKASIGIVPQEITFDPFFTPLQILDLMAGMYGVPARERRSMELLETMGLADKAGSYTRSLSGGMKRRLMIAKAMVHSPPILVLDEPTAGVDIELRKALWDNVRALNAKGVTILLTTHYLEEAEELCDRIAIINHGKVIADEDKETLLSRINNKEIRFRLDRPFDDIPSELINLGGQKSGKRSVTFRYSPGEFNVDGLIGAIQKCGYGIADISTKDSDLEDVFLQLTSAAA
ncbi:MAG: multidrug ABC transporter ATP-binding protein [Micavibrio sp.]|nr:multidrug ABC transporter ATP-binding protein [Micavibrio sp.]|tara:strand:- start:11206 stop:12141 length:936 start_codon:yes stop_codon:yes gene_type:complete